MKVRDRKGTVYTLTQKIGEGGQGIVYRVDGSPFVVKLLSKKSKVDRDYLSGRLAFVRRLDLEGLNIARPLETLESPHCGYVMRLLREMIPISSLFVPERGVEMTPKWYADTGGLRRRLRILAKLSLLISKIHSRGLIYGDLSSENVFISKDSTNEEVWLIDADNLHYESRASESGYCIYTPSFGAPELVNGVGCSTSLSDNFALTVLCFRVLSLVHPFLGDYVNQGEPELEEAAFAGNVPWVEDSKDTLNQTQNGVPRAWVLSKRMKVLFQRCFEEGRLDRTKRPSASAWAECLSTAAESTLECPDCSASFFLDQANCPFCEAKAPTFCQYYVFLWDPTGEAPYKTSSGRPKPFGRAVLNGSNRSLITRSIAYGSEADNRDEEVFRVRFSGNSLEIEYPDDLPQNIRFLQGNREIVPSGKKTRISFSNNAKVFEVHFGPEQEEHRYLLFGIRKAHR